MAWYSTAFLHAVGVHMKVNKNIFTNAVGVKVLKLGCADYRRFSVMSDLKMHTPRVSASYRGRKH